VLQERPVGGLLHQIHVWLPFVVSTVHGRRRASKEDAEWRGCYRARRRE
jgi:hypothetical protein